jgi:hypothetical protein
MLVPVLGILFDRPADDPVQFRREVLPVLRHRLGIFIDDGVHQCRFVLAPEGEMTGEDLEEDDAEGEDIRARVDFPAAHLFRRHIGERANGAGGLRQLERTFEFRKAKVHHLDPAVGREHDVVALDIPVHDTFHMSRVEGFTDLDGARNGVLNLLDRRTAPEGLARHIFHDDELLACGLLDVDHRTHIGVVEGGRRPGFLEKAGLLGIVRGEVVGEKLQRNGSVQLCVVCLVHDPHAPFPEFFENGILRNRLTYHGTFLCTVLSVVPYNGGSPVSWNSAIKRGSLRTPSKTGSSRRTLTETMNECSLMARSRD